jgi:4'-phosphopantetheinyl transferase
MRAGGSAHGRTQHARVQHARSQHGCRQHGRTQRGAAEVAPGDVHAWLLDLDMPPDVARQALCPAELAQASSYLLPQDGARFAASRAWLRVILSRYLGADPAHLRFATSLSGRPALAAEHAGLIHFSLSRSADRALLAVSLAAIGADIELVSARAGLPDLIASRFGPAEARCIAGGCGGSLLRSFYRHWTAKEAYLKATGHGLAGLRTTELTCGANPAVHVGGRPATRTLSLLETASDCVAAIVGDGPVTSCRTTSQ